MHLPGHGSTAPADILALYRWAVQDPETHATVLRLMYERLHPGHVPVTLREDFAGTSAEAVAWVALDQHTGPARRAVAVDLDGGTLAWARRRALAMLGPKADRLHCLQADVMAVAPPAVPAADILSVLNFSICYLQTPDALLAYLRHARQCLASTGVLVLNLFGGTGTGRARRDRHLVTPRPRLSGEPTHPPFEYVWQQGAADPRTGRIDCRIHFRLAHPSQPGRMLELRDAFRYDWHLWTLAELSAALQEAGFDNIQVWRHTYDPSRGAAGVFLGAVPPESLQPLDLWTAYIVASCGGTAAG